MKSRKTELFLYIYITSARVGSQQFLLFLNSYNSTSGLTGMILLVAVSPLILVIQKVCTLLTIPILVNSF